MKPDRYAFLLTLLALANSALLQAEEEGHDKKALEHLEQAIRSGKEGNVKGISSHTEEGKKELIEANKEHPYTNLQKPIYGEHEKAEHDKEAFEEMNDAIGEAQEGHVEEAVEAVERASMHVKEKIDSK